MTTISEALHYSLPLLVKAEIDTPRLDAQLILAWVCKMRREDLAREPERRLTARELAIFYKAIELRAQRRPLPYITGEAWFYGRPFKVNRAVLIPRPETELLVNFAERIAAGSAFVARIADVGTGSGCIAVTVAAELPNAEIVATDISRLALLIAAKNSKRYGVEQRVEFREGDLCAPLAGEKFDMVLSNPPYIDISEAPALMAEVRDYEPALALYGTEDVLAPVVSPRAIRQKLMAEAQENLLLGGWLAIELGAGQDIEARADAAKLSYTGIDILMDHAGIGRVLVAQKPR